ncbi:MAG: glycoside hydrolase family 172 protein [Planctomycetota bacterium]|jgi:hypothetical protein
MSESVKKNLVLEIVTGIGLFILIFGIAGCQLERKSAAVSTSAFESLYRVPDDIEMRWASAENWKGQKGVGGKANFGRKGYPAFSLKAGQSKVLAEVKGTSGMVRRIWITIMDRSSKMLRGIKLDMYWDGAEKPAVSAPLGDFFCHNIGRMVTFESALFSSPEARSFNCCVPMPFKAGMKVVVTNQADKDTVMYFDVDYTIGDEHPDDTLYFHAHYRRENPTAMQKDYELLPKVYGKGRFLGVNIGVIVDKKKYFESWWGEGEVKMYIDGDSKYPTLCGTGTEDYIGTGWGQGRYDHMYQGCHIADKENMEYGFYRLHIPDPVYFKSDIRVTMQQIGGRGPKDKEKFIKEGTVIYKAGKGLVKEDLVKAGPWGLFEREDDWSSCAYFYLDMPISNLPEIDSVEQRLIKKSD